MATEIKDLSTTATAPAADGRIPWQNLDGTYGSATPAQIATPADVVTAAANITDGRVVVGSGGAKGVAEGTIAAASIVTGPASAVANRVASFDDVTGKIIKDSGIITTNICLRDSAGVRIASGTTDEVAIGDEVVYYTNASGCTVDLREDFAVGVSALLIQGAGAGAITLNPLIGATLVSLGAADTSTGVGAQVSVVVVQNADSESAVWAAGGAIE